MISARASGAPHPMFPDSGFRFHINRRTTVRAASGSVLARAAVITPKADTACHLTLSSPWGRQAMSGEIARRGGHCSNSSKTAASGSPERQAMIDSLVFLMVRISRKGIAFWLCP